MFNTVIKLGVFISTPALISLRNKLNPKAIGVWSYSNRPDNMPLETGSVSEAHSVCQDIRCLLEILVCTNSTTEVLQMQS